MAESDRVLIWLSNKPLAEPMLTKVYEATRHHKAASQQPETNVIDPLHKSHNALDRYPTMHHYVTEMSICAHFVTKWCIVGYGTGALWDLYNRFILIGIFWNEITYLNFN